MTQWNTPAKQARLDRYAELRDGGMRPVDAWQAIGITDQTGEGYERYYKRLRHLPPSPARLGWSNNTIHFRP